MGVYIKGIKKPDRCEACYCSTRDNRYFDVICDLLHRTVAINDCNYEEPTIPPKDCPLVEVAEPHGHLIDTDGLLTALPSVQSSFENDTHGKWIPISERLPECEQEVLICTEKKILGENAYIDSIVTPAIYEDGTMLEVNSIWHWEDIDFTDWDDTEDCGIIPKGWFENRHFNPDDVYNNPVDRKVVAWMPLPKPYKESDTK